MSEQIPPTENQQAELRREITDSLATETFMLLETGENVIFDYRYPYPGLRYVSGLDIDARHFTESMQADLDWYHRTALIQMHAASGSLLQHFADRHAIATPESLRYGTMYSMASWQQTEFVADKREIVSLSLSILEKAELFDMAHVATINRHENTSQKQTTSLMLVDDQLVRIQQPGRPWQPAGSEQLDYGTLHYLAYFLAELDTHNDSD